MKTTLKFGLLALTASTLALAACGGDKAAKTDAKPAVENMVKEMSALQTAAMDESRGKNLARNDSRNPVETLEFFGLEPGMNVVEIWPGGGWYSSILAPYATATEGTYTAALFPETSDYAKRGNASFRENFPTAQTVTFGKEVPFQNADGSAIQADMIVTFRNTHSWMGGAYADQAMKDFYAALKPGGTLGLVQHRLPATAEQDPRARSGYVQEDYVIMLAKEAGFEFVGKSDANANPKDTADHPFGVWTLPPVNRRAKRGEEPAADFDGTPFEAIGESDRMTLKFRKPE